VGRANNPDIVNFGRTTASNAGGYGDFDNSIEQLLSTPGWELFGIIYFAHLLIQVGQFQGEDDRAGENGSGNCAPAGLIKPGNADRTADCQDCLFILQVGHLGGDQFGALSASGCGARS
jgi:hypothetical protein